MSKRQVAMAANEFMPAGTVYGTALNFRAEVQALAPLMDQPPYRAPPKAPVLYIKPANTWSAHGATIPVPRDAARLEVGATVAMVMGAPNAVAAYVLMNDLSLPQENFFRPPVRFNCRDGFLGIGARAVAAQEAGDPSRFVLEVRVNGELRQRVDFSGLLRPAAQLLAEVSEFMTLRAGDVLMLGCDAGRPAARTGDRIEIGARGFGVLANTLVEEAA